MQITAADTADLAAAIASVTSDGDLTDRLLAALLPTVSGIVTEHVTADRGHVLTQIGAIRESLNQQFADLEAAHRTPAARIDVVEAPRRPVR